MRLNSKLTIFALLCALLMLASSTAGCVNRDSGDVQVLGRGKGQVVESTPTRVQAEPESRLNIVIARERALFPEKADPNEHPDVHELERRTGLDLHLTVHAGSGVTEVLNAAFSSERTPDLIHTDDADSVAKFAREGLLLPLDDLISRHAPDLFRLFPKEAWDAVTLNGKIYAVPSLAEVPADEIIYARKDWLDALNLDPPRTLEEYYRVMRAFTYEDPDRNGKNDTWGLTIMPAGLSRTAPFFGAFGVPRSDHAIRQWKLRNGELVYSGLLPETLEALRYLARLYGDGILDREFVLNKEAVFAEKITSGRVGLFAARWNETASILQDTLARNPQAEWIRLDYPVGRDGQQGTRQTDLLQAYNVIPAASSAAKARDAIRLLNEIAGPAHRELLLAADPAQFALQAPSSREVVRPADAHSSLYALANPDDPDTRGEWLDSLGEQLALEDNIGYAMEHALHSDFRGLPTPSMGKYADKLQKLEEEAFLKLIMGLEPRNDFDDFTKLWLSEGGWELSKEVNAWYRELGGNGQ